MATEELWTALDKLVTFTKFLWKGPVYWGRSSENKMQLNTSRVFTIRQKTVWTSLILLQLATILAILCALLKETFGTKEAAVLPKIHFVLYIYCLFAINLASLGFLALHLHYRHEVVLGSNSLIQWESSLAGYADRIPRNQLHYIRKEVVEVFLLPVIFGGFCGILISVVYDMDPFLYWYGGFLLKYLSYRWTCVLLLVRITYIFLIIFEAIRGLLFLIPTTIVYLQQQVFCLKIISLAGHFLRSSERIKLYSQQVVLFAVASEYLNGVALVCMSLGMVIKVLGIFVSVKMYGSLGMPLFLVFPVMTLVLVVFGIVGITADAWIFEKSKELKRLLVLDEEVKGLRLIKRRVASLAPMKVQGAVGGFRFYLVNRSTMGGYYSVIVGYSINALLSIPAD